MSSSTQIWSGYWRTATHRSRIAFALSAVFVLFAGDAAAETLRVPRDFPTIQAAVDAALPGDIVRISRGDFNGFTVGNRSSLEIRGGGGHRILSDILVRDSSDIVLRGLRVESNVALVRANSSRIERFRFYPGSYLFAGDGADITIERNRFDGSQGMVVHNIDGFLVAKNSIRSVTHNSIFISDGTGEVSNNKIRDLQISIPAITVSGNAALGVLVTRNRIQDIANAGVVLDGGSKHVVHKNRITRSSVAINCTGGSSNLVEGNKLSRAAAGVLLAPQCQSSAVIANSIDRMGSVGVVVDSSGNRISANKIRRVELYGIFLSAGGNVVTHNSIRKILLSEIQDADGNNVLQDNHCPENPFNCVYN